MSERTTIHKGPDSVAARPSVSTIAAAEGRHFFQFEGDGAQPRRVPSYVEKGIPAEKSIVPNMNA